MAVSAAPAVADPTALREQPPEAVSDRAPESHALAGRVSALLAQGRAAAARRLLAAVAGRIPPADGAELDARLRIAEGRLPEALALLDTAIPDFPDRLELRLLRADVRARANDAVGAAQDAAEAVILAPGNARAKTMLGLTLLEIGDNDSAIACLDEAARQVPTLTPAWSGLAEALRRAGRGAELPDLYDRALALLPRDAGIRVQAIIQACDAGDFERAIRLGREAARLGVADARILGLVGHALSCCGRGEEASAWYLDALKLAPEDLYVRYLVASAGLLPSPDRAPSEYVKAVFDGYADRFDEHLIYLGYRVPGLIRQALIPAAETPSALGHVLDLGCGTGLVGEVLADLPHASLTGVDISERMLAAARQRGRYAELVSGEIGQFLAAATRRWNTVVAADVLCYFGELAGLFAAVRSVLAPDGAFAFSVETGNDRTAPAPDAPWCLTSRGRYIHARSYIETCLRENGFEIAGCAPEILRFEEAEAVGGLLVLARAC